MKKNSAAKYVWIIFVLLALVVTIACAKPAPAPIPNPPKTLQIGCTLPLNQGMGLEAKKMFDVIIPDFNAKGGITIAGQKYNIEMLIEDDSYKAETGRAAVEKLVNQNQVKYIVGQLASAPIVAGLPVTEQSKVLVICGGIDNTIITKNQYTLRTATVATFGAGFRNYILKKYPNIKTTVAVGPDDATGKQMTGNESAYAKAFGLNHLKNVLFPRETEDYSGVGLEIARLNPDFVVIAGANAGTQTGGLLKAMYQAGYKGKVMGTTPDLEAVKKIATNEALEGFTALWKDATMIPKPSPLAAYVKDLYIKKYSTWNDTGFAWIGAWYAFIELLKKADSLDVDKLMAATEKLEYDQPQAHSFLVKRPDLGVNRYCDTAADVIIGTIKGGEFVYLDTLSAAENLKANEIVFGGGSWR